MAETDGRNGVTASGAPRANVPRSMPKYHRLEGGEILEYTASKYRADRYEYSTRHVFGAE